MELERHSKNQPDEIVAFINDNRIRVGEQIISFQDILKIDSPGSTFSARRGEEADRR